MDMRDLSMGELLGRLTSDMRDLVRAEVSFAKLQLQHYGKGVAKTAVFFGAAAMLGLAAFFVLTGFFVALLALLMPVAVAALIVAATYGIIAAVCANVGLKKLRAIPAPDFEAVAQNVKEDIQWTRMQAGSRIK